MIIITCVYKSISHNLCEGFPTLILGLGSNETEHADGGHINRLNGKIYVCRCAMPCQCDVDEGRWRYGRRGLVDTTTSLATGL